MKIAKLSLVAAVAVAGFTTANAQPLEEAIKNVDVSGSMVYRYNDYNGQDKASANAVSADDTATNNYKIGLNLSSKVNDDVKANTRFIVGKPSVVAGTAGTTDSNFASLDTSANADQNVNVELSQANFAYTGVKNTTVTVGKQGLATPWTKAEQIDGNEQTGTGALAMTVVGPVTFAGAYFNQTNLNTSSDVKLNPHDSVTAGVHSITTDTLTLAGQNSIATVGAIAAVGPVTVDAWYLDLEKTFDTYTVGAKTATEVAGIKLGADARYASLTMDPAGSKANTLAKIAVTAKAGIVDGKVAYAKTGKDGGLTALDNDATTTLLGWNIFANGKADADYLQLVAGVDVLANLNLSANYGDVKYVSSNNDMEDKEVYAQALYKMSKNLTTYVRYGQLTKENTTSNITYTDGTVGRLQVAYTF